jgi:hypothetical protein
MSDYRFSPALIRRHAEHTFRLASRRINPADEAIFNIRPSHLRWRCPSPAAFAYMEDIAPRLGQVHLSLRDAETPQERRFLFVKLARPVSIRWLEITSPKPGIDFSGFDALVCTAQVEEAQENTYLFTGFLGPYFPKVWLRLQQRSAEEILGLPKAA